MSALVSASVGATGALAAEGAHLATTIPSVNVGGVVSAGVGSSTVDGSANETLSSSSLAGVRVVVAGVVIAADVGPRRSRKLRQRHAFLRRQRHHHDLAVDGVQVAITSAQNKSSK